MQRAIAAGQRVQHSTVLQIDGDNFSDLPLCSIRRRDGDEFVSLGEENSVAGGWNVRKLVDRGTQILGACRKNAKDEEPNEGERSHGAEDDEPTTPCNRPGQPPGAAGGAAVPEAQAHL